MDRLDIPGHGTAVALARVEDMSAVVGKTVEGVVAGILAVALGAVLVAEGIVRIVRAVVLVAWVVVLDSTLAEEWVAAPAEPVVHTTQLASYSLLLQPSSVPSEPLDHFAPASINSHSPLRFSPSHPWAIKPSSTYFHTPSTFNTFTMEV